MPFLKHMQRSSLQILPIFTHPLARVRIFQAHKQCRKKRIRAALFLWKFQEMQQVQCLGYQLLEFQ